jgi:hypothetical protein
MQKRFHYNEFSRCFEFKINLWEKNLGYVPKISAAAAGVGWVSK